MGLVIAAQQFPPRIHCKDAVAGPGRGPAGLVKLQLERAQHQHVARLHQRSQLLANKFRRPAIIIARRIAGLEIVGNRRFRPEEDPRAVILPERQMGELRQILLFIAGLPFVLLADIGLDHGDQRLIRGNRLGLGMRP